MTPTTFIAAGASDQNPMIPAVYDIVWSLVCFVIILRVFWKLILPKFKEVLDERSRLIQGGIEKAERAQAEADAALEEYRMQLAEGRAEAARLRAEAQEDGAQIIADMKQQANEEAERIISTAKAQIAAERQAAMISLRSEVGSLATDLASRIVGESLQDDARSNGVVDRFIADLEAQAPAGKDA